MQLQCFYQGNKTPNTLADFAHCQKRDKCAKIPTSFEEKVGSIFLVPKLLTQAPQVRASRGVWGYPHQHNFANLISPRRHSMHFDTAAVFNIMENLGETMIIGQVNVRQSVLHSDHNKILKISNFAPCFQNFIIDWENVIKIRRTGGNPGDFRTNWEG